MNFKLRRRLYSQNNLCSPKLVNELIRRSSIGKKDLVLEIGPGRGIITKALLDVAKKVIAVELDENHYKYLKYKFINIASLELVNCDFLRSDLPDEDYKVFANIPFSITADIVRKLTRDDNFQEGYLVLQKEAAVKFMGMPYDTRNQMMATLLRPWFEIEIFCNFSRYDFFPVPSVRVVMAKITRRTTPFVRKEEKKIYESFVVYTYNRYKVSKLSFEKFINLYRNSIRSGNRKDIKIIYRQAETILRKQQNISKIRRTRNDRNWRKMDVKHEH